MTKPLKDLDFSAFAPSEIAVFLDFDGTLVDIAGNPDAVHLTPEAGAALGSIAQSLDGAVAIVTGRDIANVDSFLSPICLPTSGVHGLTRRSADGRLHHPAVDNSMLDGLEDTLRAFADKSPEVLIERKAASVALHYRARHELASQCLKVMEEATRGIDDIHLIRGNMVIEAKAGRAHKGTAIAEFLEEPPFAGRKPLFAGDDLTDEDAFKEVNQRNGLSIKVGDGETVACYRAESRQAFAEWLIQFAASLSEGAFA